MNDFTFCGMLIHVPVAGTFGQYNHSAETTAIKHLRLSFHCRFDEWNSEFLQVAT